MLPEETGDNDRECTMTDMIMTMLMRSAMNGAGEEDAEAAFSGCSFCC